MVVQEHLKTGHLQTGSPDEDARGWSALKTLFKIFDSSL
jgi:hypothetical protein